MWRELRRSGAVPLGTGTWALPDTPLAAVTIEKIRELLERAPDAELVVLDATGRDDASSDRLAARYTEAREDEWSEFISDCAKFHTEIEREVRKKKFTLAELEEEEQSLDRLRRWHRELSLRDIFGAPSAEDAAMALKESRERLEDFTELVYRALGQ